MAKKEPRSALVAGATGLVGTELVRQIGLQPRYASLHVLVRRHAPALKDVAKLSELVVDFEALPALPAADDVYIALGTTIRVAGSQQAFRRVDHDYVLAVARAARAAGATRLGVVSALGADAASRVFYNRVKGEMENAVMQLGYDSVVIARPSLLLGERRSLDQPSRAGEAWAQRLLAPVSRFIPSQIRPVAAADVARALLRAVLSAEPGVLRVSSRDMHQR